MSHSITAKLNKAAREHANSSGVTFFVSLGEKNYDFKQKTNVWTNYDAALFAKDGQVDFYFLRWTIIPNKKNKHALALSWWQQCGLCFLFY